MFVKKNFDEFDEYIVRPMADAEVLGITGVSINYKRKNKTFKKHELAYLIEYYNIPLDVVKRRLGIDDSENEKTH